MSKTRWPDDHPNAKIMSFIESSRLVLERAAKSPAVEATAILLDRVEALIDQMTVGRTVAEINQLVSQVVPLANEAVARMQAIRADIDAKA